MSEIISFSCSSCGSKLKAPERKAGNSFPCPKCNNSVRVPVPARSMATAPPAIPPAFSPDGLKVRPLTSPVLVTPATAFDAPTAPAPETQLDEQTIVTLHPSMWRTSPVGVIVWCLFIPVFGLGLLGLLSWWWRLQATTVTVTTRRTTLRTGILSKRTTEVWHRDVRNVQITQSVFQRMMRVGKIGISSAANSGIEIEVDGIADPERIRAIIDQHRIKT